MSHRGMLAHSIVAGLLLTRDPSVIAIDPNQDIPNPEDYGFKVTRYLFQEIPHIRQIACAVKA